VPRERLLHGEQEWKSALEQQPRVRGDVVKRGYAFQFFPPPRSLALAPPVESQPEIPPMTNTYLECRINTYLE
jgi:hypothetical protein